MIQNERFAVAKEPFAQMSAMRKGCQFCLAVSTSLQYFEKMEVHRNYYTGLPKMLHDACVCDGVARHRSH